MMTYKIILEKRNQLNLTLERMDKSPKGMGFKIGRNSKKINYIRIDLDRGKDLYNMEFIRMARKKGELSPTLKVVKKIKGVYADQLRDLFTITKSLEIKNKRVDKRRNH